jgi:hypothetical protein
VRVQHILVAAVVALSKVLAVAAPGVKAVRLISTGDWAREIKASEAVERVILVQAVAVATQVWVLTTVVQVLLS